MGPVIPDDVSSSGELIQFDLKPFDTSTTYQNLLAIPFGVMHVVDDVMLFARAAIGQLTSNDYSHIPAEKIKGRIIEGSCRAYEFEVDFVSPDPKRPVLKCRVLKNHFFREFWGFNRARHGVLEAAILATRLDFLPFQGIIQELEKLETIVAKTGGARELEAFGYLREYINKFTDSVPQT